MDTYRNQFMTYTLFVRVDNAEEDEDEEDEDAVLGTAVLPTGFPVLTTTRGLHFLSAYACGWVTIDLPVPPDTHPSRMGIPVISDDIRHFLFVSFRSFFRGDPPTSLLRVRTEDWHETVLEITG
jgi:hypothetical protein